jgi:hypothetical protein
MHLDTEGSGGRVDMAANGKQHRVAGDYPDALELSGISGFQAVRRPRPNPSTHDILLIAPSCAIRRSRELSRGAEWTTQRGCATGAS